MIQSKELNLRDYVDGEGGKNRTFPFGGAKEADFVTGSSVPPKRKFVEADCKCALTDTTTGYCSSVIGTDFYERAVRAERLVL